MATMIVQREFAEARFMFATTYFIEQSRNDTRHIIDNAGRLNFYHARSVCETKQNFLSKILRLTFF